MPTIHHHAIPIEFERHWDRNDVVSTPTVLCHGMLSTSAIWNDLVRALPRWPVVTLRLRGHGLNGPGFGQLSLDDFADDMIAVLDEMGTKSAILGGSSLGGLIALRVAQRIPERVAGLVLAGAPAYDETDETRARHRATLRAVERHGMRAVLRSLAAVMFGKTTRLSRPDILQSWIDAGSSLEPRFVLPVVEAALARGDVHVGLDRIVCPTLVVHGEEDAIVPLAASKELARAIRSAHLVVVPRSGHLIPLEQPEIMAQHIGSFFRTIVA